MNLDIYQLMELCQKYLNVVDVIYTFITLNHNFKMNKKTILQQLISEFEEIKEKCKSLQEMIFFDGILSIIEGKYLDKEKNQMSEFEEVPSDEKIIQLAKNNCMLHRTSDDLGFLVTFDLNDLRNFSKELLTFKTNE